MPGMEIEVIRSARRKKTISARMKGDTMVVRAPANISEAELQKAIDNLKTRMGRHLEKKALSNDDLEQRARMLNRRHFGGKLRWRSIRWVANQNKRFGSCTPTQGAIRISHRVGALPQWVQDYVIVHELAHLREANHGPRFWKLVDHYPLTERARGYLMALGLEEGEPDDPEILTGGNEPA
jgi:predicted metal-dependent hydrolase